VVVVVVFSRLSKSYLFLLAPMVSAPIPMGMALQLSAPHYCFQHVPFL
jgi:hypothetical protein